jgi:hypothetical protein
MQVLLRSASSRHVEAPLVFGSDRQGQLIERNRHPPACQLLDRQLVVAAPNVLHEGMSGDHDPGATVLLEATHRPKPRLQPAVVRLDPVVGVLVGSMPGGWRQLCEHARIHRRVVGDGLDRGDLGGADGMLEEPAGGPGVAPRETNTSTTRPDWSIAR